MEKDLFLTNKKSPRDLRNDLAPVGLFSKFFDFYGDKKTRTFLFGMQNQYITRYTMSP